MPTGKSRMEVATPNSGSRMDTPTYGRSRLVPVDRPFSISGGISYFSSMDTVSAVDNSIAPTGDLDLVFGNSGVQINAGETLYIGTIVDPDVDAVGIPMPECTLTSVRFSCKPAPGSGQTFTYAVMKNGVFVSGSTGVISGSGRSVAVTVSIAFSAGDTFAIRVVASASAASGYHSYSGSLE